MKYFKSNLNLSLLVVFYRALFTYNGTLYTLYEINGLKYDEVVIIVLHHLPGVITAVFLMTNVRFTILLL